MNGGRWTLTRTQGGWGWDIPSEFSLGGQRGLIWYPHWTGIACNCLTSLNNSTTRSIQIIVIITTTEGNSWNGNIFQNSVASLVAKSDSVSLRKSTAHSFSAALKGLAVSKETVMSKGGTLKSSSRKKFGQFWK